MSSPRRRQDSSGELLVAFGLTAFEASTGAGASAGSVCCRAADVHGAQPGGESLECQIGRETTLANLAQKVDALSRCIGHPHLRRWRGFRLERRSLQAWVSIRPSGCPTGSAEAKHRLERRHAPLALEHIVALKNIGLSGGTTTVDAHLIGVRRTCHANSKRSFQPEKLASLNWNPTASIHQPQSKFARPF